MQVPRVMDFDVRGGKVQSYKYRLLPVFSNLLRPTRQWMHTSRKCARRMKPNSARNLPSLTISSIAAAISTHWDQLIVDALMEVKGADAAFSPGFRWGTTLLPGEAITMERLMDQTAITYPQTTLTR